MPAYYNEIDDHAAQWLRNLIDAGHLPPGDVDERSILDIQPEDLNGYEQCHFFAGIGIWGYGLRRVGWADSSPIWTGSCPCQPFSAAGRGLGFVDERHLWPAWFHLIAQREPPRIVGEQVASKDGLGWLDLVSTDLENAGYAFAAADLCAAGFSEQGGDRGGFHLRQRLYFVAVGDELGDSAGERRRETRDEYRRDGQAERDCRAGAGDRLADGAADGRRQERADAGRSDGGNRAERRPARPGGGGDNGMADASSEGAGRNAGAAPSPQAPSGGKGGENGDDGSYPRVTGGANGGLADAPDSDGRGGVGATETRARPQESGGWRHTGGGAGCDPTDRQHGVSDNGARRANANLVYCRDDRWRPIEPGALPLANAVPRSMGAMRPELLAVCNAAGFDAGDLAAARKYRTGALKAFGNALDAETVVGFLEAALPLAP